MAMFPPGIPRWVLLGQRGTLGMKGWITGQITKLYLGLPGRMERTLQHIFSTSLDSMTRHMGSKGLGEGRGSDGPRKATIK